LSFASRGVSVLEQNPPKQGLKLVKALNPYGVTSLVLEQNPPKQGLKLPIPLYIPHWYFCFRAKSTKTRIETKFTSEPLSTGLLF